MSNEQAQGLAAGFQAAGRAIAVATLTALLSATALGATPAPPRDVGATLGGLESIGLERAQRPAVIKLVESYFRALGTIQERFASGALDREEAARQAELAYGHLEQRLADVLTPAQLTRFQQLKAQARNRSNGRR